MFAKKYLRHIFFHTSIKSGYFFLQFLQVMTRYAEVYSSIYRIHAKFSGLRYIMYNFPITAAIFGTSFNMFVLATILLLSWYRFFAETPPSEGIINFTPKYGKKDVCERIYSCGLLDTSKSIVFIYVHVKLDQIFYSFEKF